MNQTFLKACRGEKTDYTPVWMMRQAGRFLPQFRQVLEKYGFLTICRTPELAAEVTLQPVDTLGVDAAIFFSDILTTVVPMGMILDYDETKGPYFANPIRSATDVARLTVPDPEESLGFVYRAQKILSGELASRVPLIGFAGAPFTVAIYMIEGGTSHTFTKAKTFIFTQRQAFMNLMGKLSSLTASYLKMQAMAGSNALMIFDSFAGLVGPEDYLKLNLPYIRQIISEVKTARLPIIYFAAGQYSTLTAIATCGADVISVDHCINLDDAISHLGNNVSVQGNLEPYVLLQSKEEIITRAKDILIRGQKARGHIFNLGHGVPPNTPVNNARALVDAVHELSRKLSSNSNLG